MGFVNSFLKAAPPTIMGLLMAAAGVSPKDAGSNLGNWWDATIGPPAPPWLANPSIDAYVIVVGAALIVIYLFLLWKTDQTPKPNGSVTVSQTSHGPNSPNLQAEKVRDVHFHAAPPPPAARQPVRPAEPAHEQPSHPKPQKIERWESTDKPSVSSLGGSTLSETNGLKPDIPLNGFLGRIYKSFGGAPSSDAQKTSFYKKVNREIADKVSLNNVNVWGYYGERPIQKIGKQSWDSGSFDHRQKTLSIQGDAVRPMVFRDLKFNKDEIDAIWPP
ncbi:hypothetical protein [Parasphingorhabdus sp.]|uniref:hypothetical protein n=1 Tax=Parasphingorhabdus sp. TaxID=2709688 RepID=UPI003D2E010F